MSTDVVHTRLSQLFAEEAAAAVAAAAATAAAADDTNRLPAPLRAPSIAPSLTYSESGDERDNDDDDDNDGHNHDDKGHSSPSEDENQASIATPRRRRASTRLIVQNAADVQRITGESSTQLLNRCCGGGCCLKLEERADDLQYEQVPLPDNDAFRSLQLKIGEIPTTLTSVVDLPEQTAFLLPVNSRTSQSSEGTPRPVVVDASTSSSSSSFSSPPTPTDSAISLSEDKLRDTTLVGEKEEEEKVEKGTTLAAESVSEPTIEAEASTSESGPAKDKAFEPVVAEEAGEAAPAPSQQISVQEPEIEDMPALDTTIQPPYFVQPHPPYHVFPTRIHNVRELTRPGAEKRTYHFDLDVTDYPPEGDLDFKVGGAIGITAPNDGRLVEEVLDLLLVPRFLRSKPVLLRTTKGRWPTVWGDDKPRALVTTRRDLLTWCSDIQSYPPTKALLRVLAEYTSDENEKKVLLFLCSAEGQSVFCDFRTGPHVSLEQVLRAFPSAKPPLDLLLSILQPQMPRFYSLSNDPHDSFVTARDGHTGRTRRLIEIAVTVHETSDWLAGTRTGIGSGFFERQALRFFEARRRFGGTSSSSSSSDAATAAAAADAAAPALYVPMFKGLMANPLAKQFVADGPMLLIGAGVGIAPFRGFVQRRLKTANCANKVWVLQGIRDSLVDELYSGEWGVHEDEVKRVVESRRGTGRYVQEEVRHQADLVWYVINSVDGRVFVCGSSHGMGEGVYDALVDVAMEKGNLGREEARKFWTLKKEVGQYIAETW